MTSSWQTRLQHHIDDTTTPFAKRVTLNLTPQAVTLINTISKQRGMSREEYLRTAIAAQLAADGIPNPPQLRPYKGQKVRRDPTASWQNTVQEADIT